MKTIFGKCSEMFRKYSETKVLEPAFPLLFHEDPAARTFFITYPKSCFSFPKYTLKSVISTKANRLALPIDLLNLWMFFKTICAAGSGILVRYRARLLSSFYQEFAKQKSPWWVYWLGRNELCKTSHKQCIITINCKLYYQFLKAVNLQGHKRSGRLLAECHLTKFFFCLDFSAESFSLNCSKWGQLGSMWLNRIITVVRTFLPIIVWVWCPGDTPIKSGWVCATKGLKSWPYLRMNQMKIDTLSKAQTQKMTPYAREEQKLKIFLKSLW